MTRPRGTHSAGAIRARQDLGLSSGRERALVRVGRSATDVMTGVDDLSEWDDEELKEGRRRDRHGNFSGRPPVVVPKKIHDELVRRTLAKAEQLLRENLHDAINELVRLATHESTDDKAKVKAIEMIMNRVMGRETQKVEVSGRAKWEIVLDGGIVSMPNPDEQRAS